jgi:hypothetical protein
MARVGESSGHTVHPPAAITWLSQTSGDDRDPVPNAKKGKQAARHERVAVMRAQQKRAEQRRNLITIGAITAVAAVIVGLGGGTAPAPR